MDLQSRKIKFIQEFLNIQSEEALSKLEKLLKKEQKWVENGDFQPMTEEELNRRISISMEDSKEGRLITSDELKANMEKWS